MTKTRKKQELGSCRPVGLQPPRLLSTRSKQLFSLCVGDQVASNILKDVNRRTEKEIANDAASTVSSFTESERRFMNMSPKGPLLQPDKLPVQERSSFVEKWLPTTTRQHVDNPLREVEKDVSGPSKQPVDSQLNLENPPAAPSLRKRRLPATKACARRLFVTQGVNNHSVKRSDGISCLSTPVVKSMVHQREPKLCKSRASSTAALHSFSGKESTPLGPGMPEEGIVLSGEQSSHHPDVPISSTLILSQLTIPSNDVTPNDSVLGQGSGPCETVCSPKNSTATAIISSYSCSANRCSNSDPLTFPNIQEQERESTPLGTAVPEEGIVLCEKQSSHHPGDVPISSSISLPQITLPSIDLTPNNPVVGQEGSEIPSEALCSPKQTDIPISSCSLSPNNGSRASELHTTPKFQEKNSTTPRDSPMTPQASSAEFVYQSSGTPFGRVSSRLASQRCSGSARRNCSLLSNNSNIQLSQEDSCDSDPEETSSKARRHLNFNNARQRQIENDERHDPSYTYQSDGDSSSNSSNARQQSLDRSQPQDGNESQHENDDDDDDPFQEDEDNDEAPPKKITRRVSKIQNKSLRNSGQSYKTSKDKVVKAREMRPVPDCKVKSCKRNELDEETRSEIFREYWNLQSFDLRVIYIANHVFKMPIKTKRITDRGNTRERTCTLLYQFEVHSVKKSVCKKCFLATLDENDGFVKRALANKSESLSGVTRPDRRGRHPSSRKFPEEILQCVQNHINKFPKYQSHYGRSHSSLLYLGADLTITKMHQLYLDDGNPKVSLSYYSKEFNKTNLKFKPPQVDTCVKCDLLNQSIKHASGEAKEKLEEELKEHHEKSQGAYASKRKDKEACANNPSKQVIVFDLQQVLQCPLLSSGNVFYMRQLSVFNLTIFECEKRLAVNSMWHEGIAGRGANEIASCLTAYFRERVPPEVDHIIMYSDTCGGQNKNSHVCAAMIETVSSHPSIKIIDQKFLVSGHTHLECDQVHGQIEKRKKKTTCELHHPSNYFNFVRGMGSEAKPYAVKEMVQEDFLDYEALLTQSAGGPLISRKKNMDGELFYYQPVQWFRFLKQDPTTVLYKTSLSDDAPFKKISFRRRGKLGAKSLNPKEAYSGPHPISVEKKSDLLKILDQINPLYREFYEQLVTSDSVVNAHYDVVPEGVDVAEFLLENLNEVQD